MSLKPLITSDRIECIDKDLGLWKVRGFFPESLLQYISKSISSKNFIENQFFSENKLSFFSESTLDSNHLPQLQLILNDQNLLSDLNSHFSGLELNSCTFRVYKFKPDSGNEFTWHNDLSPGRKIGFSVNLSPLKFEGGVFKMRRVNDSNSCVSFTNNTRGDALFFRISAELEHCLTSVTGMNERTACAGWFITKQP